MGVENNIFDSLVIFKLLNLSFTEEDIADLPYDISGPARSLTRQEMFSYFRFGTSISSDPFMYTAVL